MKRITRVLAALICAASLAVPAFAMNWESASAKVKRSVARVDITVTDVFGQEQHGACTAFSINDLRDYFLTAAHCYGKVMTVDKHPARVVYLDHESDLMVLTVPESGEVPEVKPLAKPRECKDGSVGYVCQGEEIAAMGFGFGGYVPLLKTGNVSAINVLLPDWGFGDRESMLLSGFAYIPGMSGGPVFNADGKIVGIVQWGDNGNYIGGGRVLDIVMEKTGKYWGVNDNKR